MQRACIIGQFLVKLKEEKSQGTALRHTVRVYGSELILPKDNTQRDQGSRFWANCVSSQSRKCYYTQIMRTQDIFSIQTQLLLME